MFKFVSKKAARTLFGSLMTIVLCAVLITESTLAIFISHHDVNIAVTSGNISVTATPSLKSVTSKAWKDGAWTDESCPVNGNSATFSNGGRAYLDGGNVHLENITPGDSATVGISIRNEGTIDVKYQLQADFGENSALLDVLEFTMKRGGADQAMTLDVTAQWLSDWQSLATEASEDIELKISFPIEDVDDWDACMGQKVEITLTVLAYQGNANVTDPVPPAADELTAGDAETIAPEDVGTYKILQAEDQPGSDFLYWARQSAVRFLSASENSFGTYVSNSQTYKFRVEEGDVGAIYRPVYRRQTDGKKIVHLNVSSNSYTVAENDAGNEIDLIMQDELWYRFEQIKQRKKDGAESTHTALHNENKEYVFKFKPSEADVGTTYTAVYEEMTGENYSNFNFDNSGAVDYYAEIINPNVERPKNVEEGAGGIEGNGGETLRFPTYAKGYSGTVTQEESKKAYNENSALVNFAGTSAGAKAFMTSDGKIQEWIAIADNDPTIVQHMNEIYDILKDKYGFTQEDINEWGDSVSEAFFKVLRENYGHWGEVGHLYKHTASQDMYLGNVADDAPAVTKRISATPRGTVQNMSPTITGLYAPAGEVITFKMSMADMKKTGGMILTIGQTQMTGDPHRIDESTIHPPRLWFLTTQTRIAYGVNTPYNIDWENDEEVTFYFGSYFGGPIYVSPVNPGTHFTIEITGAVEYPHFIYGITTADEWKSYQNLSAPFFDLWAPGEDVRFCGPSASVLDFRWEDLTKASHFWTEVARISKRFPNETFQEYGAEFMFDPYIKASGAAACAYAELNTMDVPLGWMRSTLDYTGMVENGGWGSIHEFNHLYQHFGMGADVEVTNNTVNLVEFALLTNISSKRTINDDNEIDGFGGGWGASLSDPERLLTSALEGTQALAKYVSLYNSFGLESYIATAWQSYQNGGRIRTSPKGAVPYFEAACDNTGYNMTYFFQTVLHLDVSQSKRLEEFKQLPMYVPVASTYQTGLGYPRTEDGKGVKIGEDAASVMEYTTTSRPFRIPFDGPYTLDFEKHLILPKDFDFEIELTSGPQSGKIASAAGSSKKFTYTPQEGATSSGRMIFTVTYHGRVGTDAEDITGTVELVVELERAPQKIETNTLERTTYTFAVESEEFKEGQEEIAAIAEAAAEDPYQKALDAWKNGGKAESTKFFEDAMYVESEDNPVPTPGTDGTGKRNNTTISFEEDNVPSNSFVVVNGIFKSVRGPANYILGLEGQGEGALYLSTNGKNYELKVSISSPDRESRVEMENYHRFEHNQICYFRLVLAVNNDSQNHLSIIYGRGTDALPLEQLQYTDPLHNDEQGDNLIAYRIIDESKSYELGYAEDVQQSYLHDSSSVTDQKPVEGKFEPGGTPQSLDSSHVSAKFENLFDDNKSNYYVVEGINDKKPLKLMVEMNEETSANVAFLRSRAHYAPLNFKLYVGDEADETKMTLVYEQDMSNLSLRPHYTKRSTVELPFKDGMKTFRYYYLVITRTSTRSGQSWLELCGIDFGVQWNLKQPDDTEVEKHGEWSMQKAEGSTFGHILETKGAKNGRFSSVSFTFTGKNILVTALAAEKYGAMEIYIDGKFVAAVDLRNFKNQQNGITLSENKVQRVFEKNDLDDREHTITLRGKEAFNIDSFAYL